MSKNRRIFTCTAESRIVRPAFERQGLSSSLAEELAIQPTLIYQWVAMVVEQAERAFEKTERRAKASKRAAAKVEDLKEKQIKTPCKRSSFKRTRSSPN